jgi:RNA polymerase sigma-70 factor (ECF subfamily)
VNDRDERLRRFEEIYDGSYEALLGYALRRVDNPADAADVVAETFLTAWRRIGDVPSGNDARPWLFGVARGMLSNQQRGNRRRAQLAERLRAELPRLVSTAARAADDGPDTVAVGRAFRRLSDDDREVLSLVASEGLGRDQMAVVLGCSRASVRVRLHRARKRFARELRTEGIDPQRRPAGGHVDGSWVYARPDPEEIL